jgi:cellulose biosynthesis protein BcsQ
LKLLSDGISKREIRRLVHVSRLSAKKYEEIFVNHPFSYAELLKLSAADLDLIVTVTVAEKPAIKSLNAFFPTMENELKRTGVTKHFLWEKYL